MKAAAALAALLLSAASLLGRAGVADDDAGGNRLSEEGGHSRRMCRTRRCLNVYATACMTCAACFLHLPCSTDVWYGMIGNITGGRKALLAPASAGSRPPPPPLEALFRRFASKQEALNAVQALMVPQPAGGVQAAYYDKVSASLGGGGRGAEALQRGCRASRCQHPSDSASIRATSPHLSGTFPQVAFLPLCLSRKRL